MRSLGPGGSAPNEAGAMARWEVDRARVRRSFGAGAEGYDDRALVQRRAADRLLELTLPHLPSPRRILDVGAGTGALLARLGARFPAALLAGVDLALGMAREARKVAPAGAHAVGDAERLPLRTGAFDLVISTSVLQWLPHLGPALSEARRVAAPGGTVAIALFGGATLHELRGAWRAALPPDAADGTHRFHALSCLGISAEAAGLAVEALTAERMLERHADPLSLLRALKRLGAGNASGGGAAAVGLGARGLLHRMAAHYRDRHGDGAGIPATWEVLYLVARAPTCHDSARPLPSLHAREPRR